MILKLKLHCKELGNNEHFADRFARLKVCNSVNADFYLTEPAGSRLFQSLISEPAE